MIQIKYLTFDDQNPSIGLNFENNEIIKLFNASILILINFMSVASKVFSLFHSLLNVEQLIMMCEWGEGVGPTVYKKYVARGKICRGWASCVGARVKWEFG